MTKVLVVLPRYVSDHIEKYFLTGSDIGKLKQYYKDQFKEFLIRNEIDNSDEDKINYNQLVAYSFLEFKEEEDNMKDGLFVLKINNLDNIELTLKNYNIQLENYNLVVFVLRSFYEKQKLHKLKNVACYCENENPDNVLIPFINTYLLLNNNEYIQYYTYINDVC